MAEEALAEDRGPVYCLGDIVHNAMEVARLQALGLRIIDHADLAGLSHARVLIRAHGEPPQTYQLALDNDLELIDASCPVVLKLQNRVKHSYDRIAGRGGQVLIYGQPGHAEVVGLQGQTSGTARVITRPEDLETVDLASPIALFSQTTKSTQGFYAMRDRLSAMLTEAGRPERNADGSEHFEANDSICRQVSNREPHLRHFAHQYDVVLFVSGKKSSNGKALYAACLQENPRSYFIESEAELDPTWLAGAQAVGICGATSTPGWLMEQVKASVEATAGAQG